MTEPYTLEELIAQRDRLRALRGVEPAMLPESDDDCIRRYAATLDAMAASARTEQGIIGEGARERHARAEACIAEIMEHRTRTVARMAVEDALKARASRSDRMTLHEVAYYRDIRLRTILQMERVGNLREVER